MSVKVYYSGALVSSRASIDLKSLGHESEMIISSGGVANRTRIVSGGAIYISNGGVANSTSISCGEHHANGHCGGVWGSMVIFSGGTANITKIDHGSCDISSGGVANSTTIYEGRLYISSGGVANHTSVRHSDGFMCIYSGGVANYTEVIRASSNFLGRHGMYISGGVANSTTVRSGGELIVCGGGTANITTMYNGSMHICGGGVANSTTVNRSGTMYIYNGGVANSTTVNEYGKMYIDSGCVATEIIENGGYVRVVKCANVTFASNTITGLTLSSHAMTVHSNTVASSTTIYRRGTMVIYSGGVANSTTVNEYGEMDIGNGGVANSTTVNEYGKMYIGSGGVHHGSLFLGSKCEVHASVGSIIDFTVSNSSTTDTYLINDLSLIHGTPTYTITVSANQEIGTYKLARGVEDFNEILTIMDSNVVYGNISVNGYKLVYNDKSYQLKAHDGDLTLTIDKLDIQNTGLMVKADITNITNKNVMVTATFSSSITQKEYSVDNKNWKNYTSGIVMHENGAVYFRGTDKNGVATDVISYQVTNIDKIVPVLSGDIVVTENGYFISFAGEDSNGIAKYKLKYSADGKNYMEYSGNITGNSVEISDVGEIKYFKIQAIDNAGNESIWKKIIIPAIGVDNSEEYIFISSKYSEKTTGKKQNDISLIYGSNAFASLKYAGDTAGKTVILVDSKNSGNYFNKGTVAGTAVAPLIKATDNSSCYKLTTTAKGTLNISQDTGSTEFLRFATVNVTGAKVGCVSGGNSSCSEELKTIVNKKSVVTDTARNTYSLSASGKAVLADGASVSMLEGYKNVTLTNASVGTVGNYISKDSWSDTFTVDKESEEVVSRKFALIYSENTVGTFKATASTVGDVTGFVTVNLKDVFSTGDFRRVDADGAAYRTVKEALNIKRIKYSWEIKGSYSMTETFIRAGKFTAAGSTVGDIENFSTVMLDGSAAENISNIAEVKRVTTGTATWYNILADAERDDILSTAEYNNPEAYAIDLSNFAMDDPEEKNSLNGSVTLKNGALAESISNFKSVTMTASEVGSIENVTKVTVNKGDSSIGSYIGTAGNDTFTIAKGAVLTADKINLGNAGKDTLAINGTLILTGTEVVADKFTGKGEIAVVDSLFDDVSVDFANLLNVGATADNFRGTAYENADDSAKKAVKWDGKTEYNGWLGDWSGAKEGSDEVDYIKFKAAENAQLTVSGDVDWVLLDKKGNEIQEIAAGVEYTIQITNKKEGSTSYTIELA